MGFNPGRIEAALKNTSGSLEDAIEWLEQHQLSLEQEAAEEADGEDVEVSIPAGIASETTTASTASEPTESPKLLTKEDKEAKLEELRQKAAKRKAEQEKIYKEDEKKNEMIRRKRDQDSAKALEEIQRKEALKEAAKKRKEAKEDAIAKQRIRDLIAADKEARRQAKLGNSQDSSPSPVPTSSTKPVSTPTPPRAAATESKIRFRIHGQPPNAGFMKTYPVETTLGDLAESITSEVNINASSIVFQTTFPTSTYDSSMFNKTLKECGLVNTNLIVKQG